MVEPLPLAQVVIPGSWDRVLLWDPRRKPASAYVSASLSQEQINKILKKKKRITRTHFCCLLKATVPLIIWIALNPFKLIWRRDRNKDKNHSRSNTRSDFKARLSSLNLASAFFAQIGSFVVQGPARGLEARGSYFQMCCVCSCPMGDCLAGKICLPQFNDTGNPIELDSKCLVGFSSCQSASWRECRLLSL